MKRRLFGLLSGLLALAAAPTSAHAHQPPPRFPAQRPTLEVSSWVGLGGGALVADGPAQGVFDLRLGGDFTASISQNHHTRLGPFVEAASATFAGIQAVGGVELFVGAVPRPLRMFYYSGEGVFTARVGAGWVWREHDLVAARSAPLASVTLTYGYRAPFSLRETGEEVHTEPGHRDTARYMTGVRLWVGATVDLTGAAVWQLSGGIEFEPVGSFRYLLGLY